MDKAAEAFRTISEVAEELDVPQHVLRFWETRFPQIKPMKRGGGRRYYRPNDVDLLKGIRRLLYGEGFTIRGVQRILRENNVAHVADIGRGEVEVTALTTDEIEALKDVKDATPAGASLSESGAEAGAKPIIHRNEPTLSPTEPVPAAQVPAASAPAEPAPAAPAVAAPAVGMSPPAPAVTSALEPSQIEELKLALADIEAAQRLLANALK